MTKSLLLNCTFSLFCILCVPASFAQDHTQMALPDGAQARLGKGWINGAIAYSPDGARLAVASSIGIWLYDAHTGAEVALLGRTSGISSVAFSPDGKTLAGGGWNGTVRLWELGSGQERTTFRHTQAVLSVAFSPDGTTLASGGDHTIRLWDVDTGQLRTTLEGHLSGCGMWTPANSGPPSKGI